MRFRNFLFAAFLLTACSSNGVDTDLLEHNWDAILAEYRTDGVSVYYNETARVNLALAEKGLLAEKAFAYTQAGSGGIVPEWAQDYQSGALLAEIYYSMGHIAMAQRMAFETMVLCKGSRDEYMMKILVKTNLIYGAHEVAEKYLNLLKDKEFVHKYSSFVHNDEAVSADPELGLKRRCIPTRDFLSTARGLDEDLKDIIKANPEHRNTIQYLGIMYLLDNEIDNFCELMDRFYGTPALPELPSAFAQAACMISELRPSYWKQLGVDRSVFREYENFLGRLQNGLNMDRYKDTYWYYLMKIGN